MNSIKQNLSSFAGFFPFEKIVSAANGHRFLFPFWHAVSDYQPPHLSKLFCIPTIQRFEKDLDFFLKNFRPAQIDDVIQYADKKQKSNDRLFFPTFDDGLAECYHIIAPVLKRKGIESTFFINPSFVDNKMLFHRHKASLILNFLHDNEIKKSEIFEVDQLIRRVSDSKNIFQFFHCSKFSDTNNINKIAEILGIDFDQYLTEEQPYMTLDQIKELKADGFLIGAHGIDHREFFLSTEEEILNQISSSMEYLMKELNPDLKLFAFPFTDFKVSDSVFEKFNTQKICDLSFGTAGIKDETMMNHIQRIPMEYGSGINGEKIVRMEYLWYYLKTLLGKNKVSRF